MYEESKRNSGCGSPWLQVFLLFYWGLTYKSWVSRYGTGIQQSTLWASVLGASLERPHILSTALRRAGESWYPWTVCSCHGTVFWVGCGQYRLEIRMAGSFGGKVTRSSPETPATYSFWKPSLEALLQLCVSLSQLQAVSGSASGHGQPFDIVTRCCHLPS